MGQWGEKSILSMIQVPKMHQFQEVWRPGGRQSDLVLPQASHFRVSQASVTHPTGLQEEAGKAKPALITRTRQLGWDCLLQGCLRPPDM